MYNPKAMRGAKPKPFMETTAGNDYRCTSCKQITKAGKRIAVDKTGNIAICPNCGAAMEPPRMPTEITALDAMMKLITTPTVDSIGRISSIQLVNFLTDMLRATMYSLKATVKDPTTWHVFIQDWAASLNRKGLLSNTNEQLFREWAYSYMNAARSSETAQY